MKKIALAVVIVAGFSMMGLTGCGKEGNRVVQPSSENERTPEEIKAYEEDQMRTAEEYRKNGV